MIVLQREFAEGRVSKFSSAFWRIIRRNKMFLTQVKRKENKLSLCIKNGLYGHHCKKFELKLKIIKRFAPSQQRGYH